MKKLVVIGTLLVLCLCEGVLAQDAAQLSDLQIVDHHFAISVAGLPNELGVKNPAVARWLVLKVSASAEGEVQIFSHDFILRYFHADGTEDRASCDGIADCETDKPGEFNHFRTGAEPNVKLQGSKLSFGLTAYVENDVEAVELWRVGNETPLRYHIGTERRLSVFATTNANTAKLSTLAQTLTGAGYSVAISNGLNEHTNGTVIHYNPKAEMAAREVSQRLMSQFGAVPELRERDDRMLSEYDIIIWLGRETASPSVGSR